MNHEYVSRFRQCLSSMGAVLILAGAPLALAESAKEPEPPSGEVKTKGRPGQSCSDTKDRKVRRACEISACVAERCKSAPAIQRSPTCQEVQRNVCQAEVKERFK